MKPAIPAAFVLMLVFAGCVGSTQLLLEPSKRGEGFSRTFPASHQEIFLAAKAALEELEVTIEKADQEAGVILAKFHRGAQANIHEDFAGLKKRFGGAVLLRIDVKPAPGDETKLSVIAQSESLFLSQGEADTVARDIIDSVRVQMAKVLEKRPQAVTTVGAMSPSSASGSEEATVMVDADILPSRTPKKKTNAYAVVIGIESYRDLPKVDFAQRDAEVVKEYLIKALGYPEEHVIVRTNDRATRSDLESYLERWLKNNVDPGAEVFVYYAGHGSPDPKTGQAYLVPYDGNPSFLETTAYPLARLYDSLSALPAKQVLVALDSCFSGTGGRSVIAKGVRPAMLSLEAPKPAGDKLIVFSAAKGTQISSAFPEKRHGLFTYFFLKGLQGEADANKDGAVEIGELYSYLHPQVERQARRINQDQTPQLNPPPEMLKDKLGLRLIEAKQ